MIAYTKNETLLSIEHVSLAYGEKRILRDVNADIKDIVRPDCIQGQVVCFLGPSGIGKSQLSRIIAGLQEPTSGTVSVAGTNGTLRDVRKGDVGMVPQNYPLFEFATVRQNLAIAGKQRGLSLGGAADKAHDLMTALDIYDYAEHYPRDLSGGTRQRVAIAHQLMCAGHYLVMDEPFSGLDLINKGRACALITHVANLDERNTIIIVTHDVTEGLSVADTVWLMGRQAGLPGATIVEQIDMAAHDLCWHPDLTHETLFQAFVTEVKQRFATLGG